MDVDVVRDVVEGEFLVCGVEAHILFYPDPLILFLSSIFAKLIATPLRELEYALTVTTLVDKHVICITYYPNCPVKLCEVVLPAYLIVLDMYDFDIILCMDWLEAYHATMDCFSKTLPLH